jgi:hypothetical protein
MSKKKDNLSSLIDIALPILFGLGARFIISHAFEHLSSQKNHQRTSCICPSTLYIYREYFDPFGNPVYRDSYTIGMKQQKTDLGR